MDASKRKKYPYSQLVKRPVFSARKGAWSLYLWSVYKAAKRPLPGDWVRPPNKRFEPFSHSGNWANAQRCVPFALLATIENN